jgi:hypothetical protein
MYLPDATIYFQRLHLAFVLPVQVRQGTQPGEKVVLRGKGWSLWFHLRQTPLSEITLSITHTFPLFFCRNKGEKFFVVWESLCSLQHQSPNVCLFASTNFQFHERKENTPRRKEKWTLKIGILFCVCSCRELTPRQRELMEEFDKEESNDVARVAAASGWNFCSPYS